MRTDLFLTGVRLVSLGLGAGIYLALDPIDPLAMGSVDGDARVGMLSLAAAMACALAAETLMRSLRDRQGPRARTIVLQLVPMYLSLASAAALFLLSEPVIGWAAYPLLLAPLLATHHGFRQLGSVRKTFDQTINALARIPEIGGYSHEGHAQRVSELSRAIGRGMRLSDRELDEIAVAARLHDLGRLQASRPEEVKDLDPAELSAGGASVVRTTGVLPGVAKIIDRQHLPYRREDGEVDETVPLGARIIAAASTYDDLTATGMGSHSPSDAVSVMRRNRGLRFDPQVIDHLSALVLQPISR